VTASGGTSAPFDFSVDSYAPVLTGLSACHYDPIPSQILDPGERAVPGDIATVYAAGLGATVPMVPAGATPSTAAATALKPTVTVGERPAEVLSSALVTWQPGIYEVKFRVPAGTPDGFQPVVLTIGGKSTNTVTLTIDNKRTLRLSNTAPESIASVTYCNGLAQTTAAADAKNPPRTLGGTTVKVKDAAGVEQLAQIQLVSPTKVNYIVPAGAAPGNATLTVTAGDGTVSSGTLEIQRIAPSIFCGEDRECGFPVAVIVRLRNGVQTTEPVSYAPIDLGPPTDQLTLSLFGTGLRFRSSLANTALRFYPQPSTGLVPDYAGPQNEFLGLDQVNVTLPRSLAGRGTVAFDVLVDGISAIYSWLTFK
jgi:uncharacterized protein (TIGR03437 family)